MARVQIDASALQVLTRSPAGPIGVYLARGGAVVASAAKGRAPVRTGRLKGAIDWQIGTDGSGMFVDIMSPALSDKGFPYPLVQERRYTPHLVPSLADWPG